MSVSLLSESRVRLYAKYERLVFGIRRGSSKRECDFTVPGNISLGKKVDQEDGPFCLRLVRNTGQSGPGASAFFPPAVGPIGHRRINGVTFLEVHPHMIVKIINVSDACVP